MRSVNPIEIAGQLLFISTPQESFHSRRRAKMVFLDTKTSVKQKIFEIIDSFNTRKRERATSDLIFLILELELFIYVFFFLKRTFFSFLVESAVHFPQVLLAVQCHFQQFGNTTFN